MESGDLHIRIGPRGKDGQSAVLVRILGADGRPFDFEALIYVTPTEIATPAVSPDVVALIAGQVVGHIKNSRDKGAIPQSYLPLRILLEIEPLDLVGFDWENILSLAPFAPSVIITRFRAVSDMRVVRSFELPLSVLHAPRLASLDTSPSDAVMKYFQYHRVSGISDFDVATLVSSAHYEVVHLAAGASWQNNIASDISIESPINSPGHGISLAVLNRALSTCRARLLILQCINESSFVPALNFGHRLLQAGGPTTLVLKDPTAHYLDDLYMDVVHDNFKSLYWFSRRPPAARVALFHAIGGDRVLELGPLAQRLLRDMKRTATAGGNLLESVRTRVASTTIKFGGAPMRAPEAVADRMFAELRTSMLAHSRAIKRVYDYSHESGAWIPLAQDRRAQVHAADQIATLQRSVDRVVNVGFVDVARERKLRLQESLQPGQSYQLSVQIGRRADWSLIDGNAAFPEHAIERQYSKDGIELRVVVFAPSFEVDEPDRRLYLDRPPAESDELRFAARAPARPGRYRIRVCIYRELNLLQSVLIRISVGTEPAVGRRNRGIKAEVEFMLSSTLADVQKLPRRQCNFLTNATDEGTHTLVVVGSGLRTAFDFEDGEMRAAVGAARDALYNIAADIGSKPPKYRFDPDSNAATIKQLEQDMIQLAELGFELYSNIVTGKDRSFADALRKSLGATGATIQVAAVKSARYVFPWSLVYDYPLVTGSLRLCPQFAADATRASVKPLSTQVCLTQGCPNHGKTDIVCPSGFWGFKHLIEQPLSADNEPNASGKRDLILEIDGGPSGAEVSALMVVSRELAQVVPHEKELRGPNSFAFQVKDTKVEASECLKDPISSAHLVYFYCHGGRDKARTWLGIGTGINERLRPADLTGLQIDWTDTHPLVFINGCHTADFTSDDLLNFNQVLSYCRAAGVIGTEISVPESLARFFASGFLTQFRNGSTVGAAMREQRLGLLERCNLLGLAYTPYCSVNLKVVRH
jgi:CHAT domain